jgi:apolipoprotein N-acyltransferase
MIKTIPMNKQNTKTGNGLQKQNLFLLILGTVLLFLTHLRFGIQIFAWVSYVPFILYLRRTNRAGSILLLTGFVFLGWTLAVIKILTGHMHWVFSILYALPITLFHLPGYLSWRLFHNNRYWWVIGAALFSLSEWLLGALTPFGTWGSIAYARVNDLPLIQLGSITGMTGISLVILLVNAAIAYLIESGSGREQIRTVLFPVLTVLIAVYTFGILRMTTYEDRSNETITVAAIDHDVSGFTFGGEELREFAEKSQETNLELSRHAAQAGARYVSWMEGSTVVFPEEEPAFQGRLKNLAMDEAIHIISSYVVPLEEDPLLMANKIAWIRPDGSLDHEYEKNVPVPSEPVRKGTLPPQKIYGNKGEILSAAICYDYDFPRIASSIGKMKAGVVFLPSGDWRGIDPLHSQMSAFRAVENGHSIVRPANSGLSAVISPVGRILGWRSDFDTPAGFLLSEVPSRKVFTLYSVLGEWTALLPLLIFILFIFKGRSYEKIS